MIDGRTRSGLVAGRPMRNRRLQVVLSGVLCDELGKRCYRREVDTGRAVRKTAEGGTQSLL